MFHATKYMNYMLLSIAMWYAASYQLTFAVTKDQDKEYEIIKLNIQKMQQAINALNEQNKSIDAQLEKVYINSQRERDQLLTVAYSSGLLSIAAGIISQYFNITKDAVHLCLSTGGLLLCGSIAVDACRTIRDDHQRRALLDTRDKNSERIKELGLGYDHNEKTSNKPTEQG